VIARISTQRSAIDTKLRTPVRFLRDDAYDAFDQVCDEVGASLMLAQHLLSGGLGILLKSRNIKDVTSRC
jgi:hypothetical protein